MASTREDFSDFLAVFEMASLEKQSFIPSYRYLDSLHGTNNALINVFLGKSETG